MIQVIDNLWKHHLTTMDQLRQGIHFRSYGQRSPKQEYKREAFGLFEHMWQSIGKDFSTIFFRLDFANMTYDIHQQKESQKRQLVKRSQKMQYNYNERQDIATYAVHNKLGRNDKCFCGSGKKFKYCHGK